MEIDIKMEIIKEFQKLKKALVVRGLIMENQLSGIKNVTMKDLDESFENIGTTLDIVLGDLDSSYFVSCKELSENSAEIEVIRQNLKELWDEYATSSSGT